MPQPFTPRRPQDLYRMLYLGRSGGVIHREYRRGEALLRLNETPDRFYVVCDGRIGATTPSPDGRMVRSAIETSAAKGARRFAVIGALPFFERSPSKCGYLAITKLDVFSIDSSVLATRFNGGNALPIVRAMLYRSDVASSLRHALVQRFCLTTPPNTRLSTLEEIVRQAEEADPSNSYENFASDILRRLSIMRQRATDSPTAAFLPVGIGSTPGVHS